MDTLGIVEQRRRTEVEDGYRKHGVLTLLLAGEGAERLDAGDSVEIGNEIHAVLSVDGSPRTGVTFGLQA